MRKIALSVFGILCAVCAAFSLGGCRKEHRHSFTKRIAEEEYFCSAATCTEEARYYYSCRCGEKGEKTFGYGSPLGHTFDRKVLKAEYLCSPATDTEKGTFYYSCFCGAKGTETFVHDAERPVEIKIYIDGEYQTSVYTDEKQDFMFEEPEKPQDLTTDPDSDFYFDGWYWDPSGRYLLDYFCYSTNGSIYGFRIHTEGNDFGLGYRTENGKVYITSPGNDRHTIVIPSVIDGLPVEGIDDEAFVRCYANTIFICEGVKHIGARAFSGCSNLRKITLPGSIVSVGESAFHASALTSVTLCDGFSYIGDYMFFDCDDLETIEIPGSVSSIGNSAFGWCDKLSEVKISEGVKSIGSLVFFDCRKLKTISLPDSITSIEESAFCDSGITEIVIPDNITTISERLFDTCPDLRSVTLPDGLISIGPYAFHYCHNLEDIEIPSGVKTIGNGAFV